VLAACLVRRIPQVNRRLATAIGVAGLVGLCAILFAGRQVWALLHHGYGLWLTGSAACIVVGAHWLEASAPGLRLRGLGWLRSFGRLSYEIYLFHMFCVFGVLGVASMSGLALRWGFVWYVPAVLLSWLLGFVVARYFSQPIERRLRREARRPVITNSEPLTQTP
jgi:peptidoglycan/LPS O-acetylase OafA/YrhL